MYIFPIIIIINLAYTDDSKKPLFDYTQVFLKYTFKKLVINEDGSFTKILYT
jgi:hypothetical protein